MAYKITDECLACGACVDECPNEAISEDDPIYVIDTEGRFARCNPVAEATFGLSSETV